MSDTYSTVLKSHTHAHTHARTHKSQVSSSSAYQVVLLQTARSRANAGVLLGARMHRCPAESWKIMCWRHYEVLWLIRHIGPFLSQNQADASLASLRKFVRGQKTIWPLAPDTPTETRRQNTAAQAVIRHRRSASGVGEFGDPGRFDQCWTQIARKAEAIDVGG